VVETQKQHVGIEVIQSFNAIITTTRMETIIAPNMNVVRRGVVIRSIVNVSRGFSGFSIRNLSSYSKLLIIST
jgi:hypothetical protein